MLARIICKRIQFLNKTRFAFSDSHSHSNYSVSIDKQSPWIKYKSEKKLSCIDGVEDVNYPLQPPLKDNPFQHLENQPFFSWNRQVYNDPWYHEDSHQPYFSAPERGYVTGDDPLESRSLYSPTQYIVGVIVASLIGLFAMADPLVQNPEAHIHIQSVSRGYVVEQLRDKNKKLNQLKARENELLKVIAQ